MKDLQSNDGPTQANKVDQAQPEIGKPGTPDIARRNAITFLAMGVGLAAVGIFAPQRAEAYYGRCTKCTCCAFEGTQNNCSNCGHQYSDHSGQTCEKVDSGEPRPTSR